MPVPTTSAFNLPIDDIIDAAYQRAFGEQTTGYDLQTANRNLGLLFQEFQSRGDSLWTIEQASVAMTIAQAGQYTFPATVVDVREMWTRDITAASSDDLTIARIPRATYELIPSKSDPGRTYQAYIDRQRDAPIANFYPVVNVDNTYLFVYSYVRRLYDVGSDYTQNVDAPVRWLPTIIAGLAWYTARDNKKKLGKEWVDDLHTDFEAAYFTSANEDSDASPTRIEVDASAYFGR